MPAPRRARSSDDPERILRYGGFWITRSKRSSVRRAQSTKSSSTRRVRTPTSSRSVRVSDRTPRSLSSISTAVTATPSPGASRRSRSTTAADRTPDPAPGSRTRSTPSRGRRGRRAMSPATATGTAGTAIDITRPTPSPPAPPRPPSSGPRRRTRPGDKEHCGSDIALVETRPPRPRPERHGG